MRYQVPLIAQPTPESCWAAAIAMIVSWSDPQRNYSPYDINAQVPNKTLFNNGASTRELLDIYPLFGMVAEPPVNYPEFKFMSLLQQYGPLFVATFDYGSAHAVVVTGLDPDPNPDKATVYINNPCDGLKPPFKAQAETLTYSEFNDNLEILVQKTQREQRVAFIAHLKSK
jgi:ABC-type bacteriocin/lantibiotic exporter with double-glycine peptidase domain